MYVSRGAHFGVFYLYDCRVHCGTLPVHLGVVLHHLNPDRQGEEGRVFFNAWQSSTTRIAEELARLIAIGTILPFPEILQRRSISCPVGGPVGGAPVTSL